MISLNKILRHFTTQSQRNRVPKMISDPKFTRKGIVKKKSKPYKYDLDQPHIKNPDLYYNSEIDGRLERLEKLERKRENRNLPSPSLSVRNLQEILDETMRRDILDKPSKRILTNLIELETRFSENESQYKDIATYATKRICGKPMIFSIRELGIAISFANKYIPYDKAIWEKLRDTLYGKLEALNYKEDSIIGSIQEENLVNSVALIVTRCSKLHCKVDFLVNSIMKNVQNWNVEEVSNASFTQLASAILKEKVISQDEEKVKIMLDFIGKKIPSLNYKDACELLGSMSKGKIHNEEYIKALSGIFIKGIKGKNELEAKDFSLFSHFSQTIANLRNFAGNEEKSFVSQFYNQNEQEFDTKSKVFIMQSLFLLRVLTGEQRKAFNLVFEANFNDLPSNVLPILLYSSGRELEGIPESLQLSIARGLSNSLEKIYDRNPVTKKKIGLLASKFQKDLSEKEFHILSALSNVE